MQSWLTQVIFLRSNVDEALEQLQKLVRAAQDESKYLVQAAEVIAGFVRSARFELADRAPLGDDDDAWTQPWVQAVVPLRFSRGDARYLLLGPRDGARRYLSEDFAVLLRLGAAVVEHVEQLRGIQMQGLVSQAELKALQAQINPHFLFNSLNTLYGTIDRGNADARRLVLNLADVFRYLLRSDRTLIEIEEELRIVRAYLEIEQLRLGAKLRTEINVDDAALRATIPLLSVQPLVENAVKHGVAPQDRRRIRASRHYFPAGHADGDRFQLRRMRLDRADGRRRRGRNRLGQCPSPAGAVLRRRIQLSRPRWKTG